MMDAQTKDMLTAAGIGIVVTIAGIFAFFALGLQTRANAIAAKLNGGTTPN